MMASWKIESRRIINGFAFESPVTFGLIVYAGEIGPVANGINAWLLTCMSCRHSYHGLLCERQPIPIYSCVSNSNSALETHIS